MKLSCDARNWDFSQAADSSPGGSSAEAGAEGSAELIAHLLLAVERDLFCRD